MILQPRSTGQESIDNSNSNTESESINSVKRLRSALSDESIKSCGILKTKEIAS